MSEWSVLFLGECVALRFIVCVCYTYVRVEVASFGVWGARATTGGAAGRALLYEYTCLSRRFWLKNSNESPAADTFSATVLGRTQIRIRDPYTNAESRTRLAQAPRWIFGAARAMHSDRSLSDGEQRALSSPSRAALSPFQLSAVSTSHSKTSGTRAEKH